MIDLDDFDPMGRQWQPVHEDFQNGASSEQVANEALKVVAAMLRACGGCSILPQLQEILCEYELMLSSHTPWSSTLKDADTNLYKRLDLLSREHDVCDKRVEMVAIRSTKRLALQLRESYTSSLRYLQPQSQLPALIIKDLIGHSFLDVSRALSVGKRFATNEQAFQFYEEIMEHIEPGAISMGRTLDKKPTADGLRRYSIMKNETLPTSSIINNVKFRLD